MMRSTAVVRPPAIPPARLGALRQQRVEALDPPRPLEQHEERHEEDRDRRDDDRDDAPGHRDGYARKAKHLRRATLLDGRLDPFLDVVLRLEEAEPATPVSHVVHIVGELLDEVVDLVDECRHEEEADPDDEGEREEIRHRRSAAATLEAAALEPLDRRVER
jgi:hypothetical protein